MQGLLDTETKLDIERHILEENYPLDHVQSHQKVPGDS